MMNAKRVMRMSNERKCFLGATIGLGRFHAYVTLLDMNERGRYSTDLSES